MRCLEASVDVAAEPEAVFDLIHDYGRRLEWDPFLREARLLDGAPSAALGVKTLCAARPRFGGLAMESVYVSFDRPRVAAVKMTRGPFLLAAFAASLRQVRVAAGVTRVRYRFGVSTRPAWLRPLMEPVAGWLFEREVRRRLAALRAWFGAAPAGPARSR